jgi:hypothetical protein
MYVGHKHASTLRPYETQTAEELLLLHYHVVDVLLMQMRTRKWGYCLGYKNVGFSLLPHYMTRFISKFSISKGD